MLGRGEQFQKTAHIFVCCLGFVYTVAFLCLWNDVQGLVGEHGLLPASTYLDRLAQSRGASVYWELPTIFWWSISDAALQWGAGLGVLGSVVVMLGYGNGAVLLGLWGLYLSFVHVGQRWFAFGWEYQLLETGFLAIFLIPFWRLKHPIEPPKCIIYLGWWLVARLMWGAGLIKLRGAQCWWDLTCLEYHFETQPIPHFLSPLFHAFPSWILTMGVLTNHIVELILPLFLLGKRIHRHVAAGLMIGFQVVLILSGNLSFLNWLSILPLILCFDSSFWKRKESVPPRGATTIHRSAAYVYTAVVLYLSLAVVQNLLGSKQVMNQSFDRLHLVNSYGAFGTVGKKRPELIIEGQDAAGQWHEYNFKCKPGKLDRRPCWITPYHYRLDWLMWFAALSAERKAPVGRDIWLAHLLWKLLHHDPILLEMMAEPPLEEPPKAVRVQVYQYHFSYKKDIWWEREWLHTWIPELRLDNVEFQAFVRRQGWPAD